MNTSDTEIFLNQSAENREVIRVTVVGSVLDLLLGIVKVSVGLVSHSQALVADGVHSFSDLATDVLVVIAARHSSQAPDEEHPYGHRRIQTAATVLLAVSLVLVALGIAWDALGRLWAVENTIQLGYLALIVAAASALFKEGVYRYTIGSANRLSSNLLKANAWHHRSDAFSSLVVIAGIGGAMAGIDWADPLAAIVVAALILHIAWKIGREGYDELIDTGVSSSLAASIKEEMLQVDGVTEMHQLRTRKTGAIILADVHIRVEPRISVSEGHRIGDAVAERLQHKFPSLNDVIVHIDPEDDDDGQPSIELPLRPTIEKAVARAFEGLRHNSPGSVPIDPTNIVLHYLGGILTVEIWIPLTDQDNYTVAEDIRIAVTKELESSVCAAEVVVLYALRNDE